MPEAPDPSVASCARILAALPDGVLEVDAAWRVRYANHGVARLFERPADQLLGHDLWEALPLLAATPMDALCRRAMIERPPAGLEAQIDLLPSSVEARISPRRMAGSPSSSAT